MNFDLSDIGTECFTTWHHVFQYAQQENTLRLHDALASFPSQLGSVIVDDDHQKFELTTMDGVEWLTDGYDRIKVIGKTQQPDGLYHFGRRHCLCPDGTLMYFD
ncbi:hypothetical protein ASF66_21700 [Pseudomonas sp. Leaf129]|uniref:hypothetical protein n=1 Tax=Pseudomonas sp. Leaf129 TaxID=1736268 RepID=UPI00070375B3|nr:hypothetical protein [Pseudomonas sp. Leaf129]KQQ55030.1 hypothetical protein ASF66_21700 [Pseudomonas sp. Leaf129]